VLNKILHAAKGIDKPLLLYKNREDTEIFHCGYVLDVTEKEVLMAHISSVGRYDGYILLRCEDLWRVESDDGYVAKTHKLYKLRHQEHPAIDRHNASLMEDLLRFAQKHRLIVILQFLSSGLENTTGFVANIHDGTIEIDRVNYEGNRDGKTYVHISDITRIDCDDDEASALRLLASDA